MKIGYAYLKDKLNLRILDIQDESRIGSVNSVVDLPGGGRLAPKNMAPDEEDLIGHLLFALKHEGTKLQVLSEAMKHIPALDMCNAIKASPSSAYLRKAGYLWETFNKADLDIGAPTAGGNYIDLYDEKKYITGPSEKVKKWRVNFNGLGSIAYNPEVRRTPEIDSYIKERILDKTNEYLRTLDKESIDRALSLAYLSETEKSFEIEREVASPTKAQTFVNLLKQAHEKTPLTEDYLSELQSATISNDFEKAASFRSEQNHLRKSGLRGSNSVSYIPPPPDLCNELMTHFMEMANELPKERVDPIVAAAVASFGFVYLHPYMDGNGRLSRFLFHHALCMSGNLEKGHLLPVSVAMKKNEQLYLQALESYSKPSRKLWDARWIGEGDFDFTFKGEESTYRYWDATPCVEFGFKMAKEALEIHIKNEVEFIAAFDHIWKKVEADFDIKGSTLHILIASALQNNGEVSKNKRRKFEQEVPPGAFDLIQEHATACLEKATWTPPPPQ